jgi:hypothetical protein
VQNLLERSSKSREEAEKKEFEARLQNLLEGFQNTWDSKLIESQQLSRDKVNDDHFIETQSEAVSLAMESRA